MGNKGTAPIEIEIDGLKIERFGSFCSKEET